MEQKDKKLDVLDYLMNRHMSYDELLEGYNGLRISKSNLEDEYNELVSNYNVLKGKYIKSIDDHQVDYSELLAKYDALEGDYHKKYKHVMDEFNEITAQLHEYINYLESNNTIIKETIIEQVGLIDDSKDQLNDNTYLLVMNNLKIINHNLK